MKDNKYYRCIKCYAEYPLSMRILTCSNHSPYYGYLTVVYDYSKITYPNADFSSPWERFIHFLPCESLKINFNEQKTPIFKLANFGGKLGFKNLYVKDEATNRTGSFKDKESICAINKAIEWGIKQIFVVSSGNAALSTAAYAQKAGINCECLVPKSLSVSKRSLINLYGGRIVDLDGNYEQIYRFAIDSNYPGWNCTPGINPIKEEGLKIIGYEIWEEIGVPDMIITPCGNGTLLYGIYKAFKELQLLGLTTKLPKLVGVQIKNAAPLKSAYKESKDFVTLTEIPNSIAEGIIAQESYSSPKVMLALADTGGYIVEVDDQEIYAGLKDINKTESIIPEPTAAVVYAAVKNITADKNSKIVLIQTAGGLKNLKEILELSINIQIKKN